MKKTDISEIMDDYTDNEFFFEDVNDADKSAIKSRVMSRVKPKPVTVKKPFKIVAAAAAAAVGLSAVAVAADLPARFFGKFKTASGIVVDIADNRYSVDFRVDTPIEYREGRVIFTACGENKDLTDIIDEETPYIYAYRNSAGLQSYLIVGGEAGKVGYADISNIGTEEEPIWFGASIFSLWKNIYVYGADLAYIGLTDEQVTKLDESDLTRAPEIVNGSKIQSVKDYEKRFVKVDIGTEKVSDWLVKAAEYLDLFEAKERMCYDPFWDPELGEKELPSDEEFMTNICSLGMYTPGSVWHRSLEELEMWGKFDYSAAHEPPIEERDGRLWVKANGTETDITDLVDENTPYILPLDRPEDWEEGRSYEAYLTVGGTPGNYKFAELFNNTDNTTSGGVIDRSQFIEIGDDVYSYTFTVDGEPIEWEQLIDSLEQGVDLTGRFGVETYYEPWYKEACDELAIMGGSVLYAR